MDGAGVPNIHCAPARTIIALIQNPLQYFQYPLFLPLSPLSLSLLSAALETPLLRRPIKPYATRSDETRRDATRHIPVSFSLSSRSSSRVASRLSAMAQVSQLPCDGDGICMLCAGKPSDEELLTCRTCVAPWHVACLPSPPPTLASTLDWECPDCSLPSAAVAAVKPVVAGDSGRSGELIAAIRAIEADPSLTEREKAKRRQELLSGRAGSKDGERGDSKEKRKGDSSSNDVLDLFGGRFNCAFCMQLLERPVTVLFFFFALLVFSFFCRVICMRRFLNRVQEYLSSDSL